MATEAVNPDGSLRERDDQLARAVHHWTPSPLSRPDLMPLLSGTACSPSGPTSRPQWKTPHGFANTDLRGKTAGGGGEFHKQAMAVSEQMQPTVAKAKLNPQFVEWLMGFPIGWTACAPVATAWSPFKRRMRSLCLQLVPDSGYDPHP